MRAAGVIANVYERKSRDQLIVRSETEEKLNCIDVEKRRKRADLNRLPDLLVRSTDRRLLSLEALWQQEEQRGKQ
jgi:hypothetical protein